MHFILLTILLFVKLFWCKERAFRFFAIYLVSMHLSAMTLTSDPLKVHELASPGGLMNGATVERGVAQGIKSRQISF